MNKLFNRNFILLWQGQLVSQIGSQAFVIAMTFWVKHETGSATLVGMLMMISHLPGVILGPLAGTIADRYSRRRIIIFCDLINGGAVLIVTVFLFSDPTAKTLILISLFIIATIVASVGSFFRPAITAAIPDIVPKNKVSTANSLIQSSVQIATFIGQGIGGVLFRILGAPFLFLFNGISYFFSAVSELFTTIPQTLPEKPLNWQETLKAFKTDTIKGLNYVWKSRGMRSLFLVATVLNFFAMPFFVLFPFYVEDFMKVSADWYGYILAAFGIGSITGYTVSGTIQLRGRARSNILIGVLIVMSSSFSSLCVVFIPSIVLIIVFFIGALNGFFNINVITILQITTPGEIRGRIFGLLNTLTMGLAPVAMGFSGVIADLSNQNIPNIYLICGGILSVISLMVSKNKAFRDFLAKE
ncbi:MAG: MFS transporter [Calditrichaeota bacterium]|nr:MAG: MFS transporter [Calditrichota bacterium]MBL1207248.1 MFS transporter [Calditrichota bacterium]NOG47081.1 MFS transporter [Calditrichota bacterium]